MENSYNTFISFAREIGTGVTIRIMFEALSKEQIEQVLEKMYNEIKQ